jgi:curved DNA-binding protein CbpA
VNYYAILGVQQNATQAEIKTAYIALSKALHPDINPHGEELMKAVNLAYETLRCPTKRRKYDMGQKVKEFVPPATNAVKPDGSIDILAAAKGFVKNPQIYDATAPILERLLDQHGINPHGATVQQFAEAMGWLKPVRRRKRA